MSRVGIGYDIHRFKKGRKLILGGIEIPFCKGLQGHSDADCLLHAVCDALLGAAGLGDIGEHFPDTDAAYEGISSIALLERVCLLLKKQGFHIINIDSIIIAQAPLLGPYKAAMSRNIARVLKIHYSRVCVKATTPENLGPIGQSLGIACWASVSLKKGV